MGPRFATFGTAPIALSNEPPSEFRIFAKGWNNSTKGPVLFDEVAARSVMAHAERWGVDMIVDLEHSSVNGDHPAVERADARDARGHFRLALREGELWAVSVKWSPDGERRIRDRTQRYISPAFMPPGDDHRVMELLNVGLVSMPATHNAQPLIAASATTHDQNPTAARKRAAAYLSNARHARQARKPNR